MATKNDLIEAQSFSRRRLLTAFVSGAPGGKELEPAAPLRAVFTAIALAAAVILVGVFWGIISPGLPKGWDNGRLVLVSDTGARYVTIDGKLHPVINTASARLLIPSDDFAIITTDQQTLSGIALASPLGIVGAPDALPTPSGLVDDGWTACVAGSGVDVRIGADAAATASTGAAVVSSEGRLYVVAAGQRFEVTAKQSDAVLRAVGLGAVDPTPVSAPWLNLFTPGTTLAPLTISGAGSPLDGTDLTAGQVVHIDGNAADELFVVREGRTLSPSRRSRGSSISSAAASVPTRSSTSLRRRSRACPPATPWERRLAERCVHPLADDTRPCALLVRDGDGARTTLAEQPTDAEASAGVRVEAGHGALVRAGGRGTQAASLLTLIDATGTAYALPGATAETVKRLGYTTGDIGTADQAWIALLRTGPALTEEAAGQTPSGGGG
ncbi:MAG: type VII secretion protein EccB [Microbacterium sp.]